VDVLFLPAYVMLLLVTFGRSRSLSWTVVMVTASVSIFGVMVGFGIDHVRLWTRVELQCVLLVALLAPAVLAFVRPARRTAPLRLQLLGIAIPVLALGIFVAFVTMFFTEQPAWLNPVSFLMGNAMAEDNAKWLDYTSMMATGQAIDQAVPIGGPLQMYLVFVATLMGVISLIAVGGYSEVLVAANSVIYGQFLLVILAPLALSPLAEAWVQRPTPYETRQRTRIPWPLIWTGAVILAAAVLLVTSYGHLTLQYTMIIVALWVSAFLVGSRVPRALLLTSLVVAAGMTVWLPMNVIAIGLLGGWLMLLIIRGVRGRGWDLIGIGLVIFFTVALWEPIRSSFAFVLASSPTAAGAMLDGVGGGARAVSAAVLHVPSIGPFPLGIVDSTLFEAGGGTERATAVLAVLAALAVVAAALVVSRQFRPPIAYVRLLPLGVLAAFAVGLNVLDQWATGSAPHYGSLKFTFMVTIVVAAVCLPVGLLMLNAPARGMTPARWTAIGAVMFLLTADTLLVRSIGAARPEQWSPPIPFENPRSYWWPADVNGTRLQPISANPVGCAYLPQGAPAPSGILDSQLSDPQRVYACTRLLAGLAGEDAGAQPLVDWLRREWLTNTRAWDTSHGYLLAMPDSVLDKPMILLDDGSNVIGLETVRSLLERYPPAPAVG
jgi:hypothetical protein